MGKGGQFLVGDAIDLYVFMGFYGFHFPFEKFQRLLITFEADNGKR